MFDSPMGLEAIRSQAVAVAAMCEALDPALVPNAQVQEAFDLLTRMHKAIGGAHVRMTARYQEVGAWRRDDARSPEEDIARRTGCTTGRARRQLQTSRSLSTQPGVDDAVREGRLSAEQADEVVAAVSVRPEEAAELLATAAREPLHVLRKRAAEARARADRDREATRRRQYQARRVVRWTDDDGMWCLRLMLPPEMGAEVDAALKPGIDRAYADARDAGRFEPYEAYAADVVHGLLTGTRSGPRLEDGSDAGSDAARPARRSQAVRPDRKVIGIIDVAALNRGHALPGETANICGVGPVAVSAIRALLADAFVSIVIKDGVDIRNVTHLGRQVTAHQRTALEARGYQCEIDGCASTHHLEIDHVTGWALTHETRVDDLAWLCPHDHRRKTAQRLRLLGPPGRRRFGPPDSSVEGEPPAGVPIQDDLFTTAR